MRMCYVTHINLYGSQTWGFDEAIDANKQYVCIPYCAVMAKPLVSYIEITLPSAVATRRIVHKIFEIFHKI